jgi:NADPH:quinone reductase-like Zn-dependent oxidoreductase
MATAGARNQAFVASLGARRVIDYARDDFAAARDAYDVVYDAAATRSFGACRRCLAPGGVYVTTVPGPGALLAAALGGAGGRRAAVGNLRADGADLAHLADLVAQGRLRAEIQEVLPLAEAAQAFALSRGGHVRGKLVVTPG